MLLHHLMKRPSRPPRPPPPRPLSRGSIDGPAEPRTCARMTLPSTSRLSHWSAAYLRRESVASGECATAFALRSDSLGVRAAAEEHLSGALADAGAVLVDLHALDRDLQDVLEDILQVLLLDLRVKVGHQDLSCTTNRVSAAPGYLAVLRWPRRTAGHDRCALHRGSALRAAIIEAATTALPPSVVAPASASVLKVAVVVEGVLRAATAPKAATATAAAAATAATAATTASAAASATPAGCSRCNARVRERARR